MPSYAEIANDVLRLMESVGEQAPGVVLHDYLSKLQQYSGRDTILYATNWITDEAHTSNEALITNGDLYGFMRMMRDLKTKKLDLILHSPGGSVESTEAIVSYIRAKFKNVRIIIPYAAMSAAAMLACSSNCLVMGKHSSIGPTDPQFIIPTRTGMHIMSAQFLISEFQEAQSVSEKHPGRLGAWLPLLGQYPPGLIQKCISSQKLSVELVQKWLARYMFENESAAVKKSKKISEIMSSSKKYHSHGRRISREECKRIGLKVTDLEDEQEFQDLVLSVFHAANTMFQYTPVNKIIMNHLGNTVVETLPTPR
ncbi:periplasmic serine protease (ClpP class) [Cenarchaeum symbiosum A]|uniref:Periplasmic serine protease (ClpP class) n=1 Tax=Cenarchaeum symbiosum (strain A) TaxID=414004 RepID=O74037_CENSY|nr:hypothetical protein 01 [Cenarchaeum symbiosum]ABK77792.1 periplasmic serine protease (ClpP class) [Cenarchaeum symbiosum A]